MFYSIEFLLIDYEVYWMKDNDDFNGLSLSFSLDPLVLFRSFDPFECVPSFSDYWLNDKDYWFCDPFEFYNELNESYDFSLCLSLDNISV